MLFCPATRAPVGHMNAQSDGAFKPEHLVPPRSPVGLAGSLFGLLSPILGDSILKDHDIRWKVSLVVWQGCMQIINFPIASYMFRG